MLKVGDKVIYTSGVYGSGDSNPWHKLKKYKNITGTIKKITKYNFYNRFIVFWSNGFDNDYSEDDLTLIKSDKKKLFIQSLCLK